MNGKHQVFGKVVSGMEVSNPPIRSQPSALTAKCRGAVRCGAVR